ncbi:MAG: cellulose-binding family [Mycobacterium sp.]|nr:cellulose-binding family [Mycobacterium sp.]
MSLIPFRGASVVAVGVATALAIAAGSGTAGAATKKPVVQAAKAATTATKKVAAVVPQLAPSGQTTVQGLLSLGASAFSTLTTSWFSYLGGTATQTALLGHSALGALAVTSSGPWTGASSPSFAVTPGARYGASTWAMAKSAAHSVGVALQFHDATGALISSATQLGQPLTDKAGSWTQTAPVVGFAPSGAVSANVIFVDYDGSAGDVQLLDDISVSNTKGVAARIVGPLKTSGSNVLDSSGRIVRFRGIDIDGLQYSNTANVTTSEIAVAQSWGANFIRLPLAENYLVAGDCSYDSTYLSKVDAMVNSATSAGMFIMLDLHTNAVTSCAAPKQQFMPDAKAVTFWQTIAARYKNNPLVGFDLYNEPHDVSDTVWRSGGKVTSSGVTYSAVGMQTLYSTVRGTGATNLVFASGVNWATAFPATGGLTGTSNLIYAAHAYTCPNGLPSSGATCTTGPDGTIYDPSGLLGSFASIATTAPVMVTEFGFPNKNDGQYIANVLSYASAHNFVGWDVYAFDNYTSGLFDLWKNTGVQVQPTVSGMAVMTGMLGS